MAEAHLERSGLALTPQEHEFVLELIRDLLGACEDAASFVSSEVQRFEAQAEADLGEERL